MTYSLAGNRFSDVGDGVTVAFSFPRLFFVNSEIKVYLVNISTGVATLQTEVTHYTLTGATTGSGTITFVTAPASTHRVVRYRETQNTQNVDLGGVTSWPMQSVEDQLDRLAVVRDDNYQLLLRSLYTILTDEDGSGRMDARSNRIINLADPTAAQDGATKNYVDTTMGAAAIAAAIAAAAAAAASASSASTSAGTATSAAAAAAADAASAAASLAALLASGKVLRTGSGAPSNGLGNDGDVYIDTTAWFVYGPKAAGVWPAGVDMIPSNGVTGPVSSTDNAIARWDGASGGIIQNSNVTIDDNGKMTFVAGASGTGSFTVPHGAAPSAPVNGDVWSTTAAFFARINGTTYTFAVLEGATFTGLVATVASASGSAGLRLPHGAAPSSPTNGDIWSTTTKLQVRMNGTTKDIVFADENYECIAVAASDETTNLTTGTAKITFHIPFDCTAREIFAGLSVAQTAGSALAVDVNKNGTTIMSSNKLVFDNNEKTTLTAATPPALTTATFTKGDEMTVDIDTVGTAGAKGLKIYMNVTRTY